MWTVTEDGAMSVIQKGATPNAVNLVEQSVRASKEASLPKHCIDDFRLDLSGLKVIKPSYLNLPENEPCEARMVALLPVAFHYIYVLTIRRFGQILYFHSLPCLALNVFQMNPSRYFFTKVDSPTFIIETLYLLWNKGFTDLICWCHLRLKLTVGYFTKDCWLPSLILKPCIENFAAENTVVHNAALFCQP